MSDTLDTPPFPPTPPAAAPGVPLGSVAPDLTSDEPHPHWVRWAVLVLTAVAAGGAWIGWNADKRVKALEQELVRRQQSSQTEVAEARVVSRQAEEQAREAVARSTLLETRLNEVALQRSQVEDLIKNLSLSRDENLVADIETGLRVAIQQASLTGSAEPLIIAMQSADERLAHAKQPRLDNVRRALARDLDRIRGTRVADINNLSIRLDEAVRLVDEVPLMNQPEATLNGGASASRATVKPGPKTAPHLGTAASDASPSAANTVQQPAWSQWASRALHWSGDAAQSIWGEARSLVRISRVPQPEGMLLAPDQSFFLRENVKLRLLNARLALLSRQSTIAQADLKAVRDALPRYFNAASSKTQLLSGMVDDVMAQCRLTTLPRPDDTLAALASVSGGR